MNKLNCCNIGKIKEKFNLKFCMNVVTVIGTIALCYFVYFCIKHNLFTSQQAMAEYLKKSGIFAPLIFILIQMIQVIIPIIPGRAKLCSRCIGIWTSIWIYI